MRTVWIIARREFARYFTTPAAYLAAFLFLLILGIIFYANVAASAVKANLMGGYAPGVEIIVNPMVSLLVFIIPAITMRLLAEEQRMGTIELLLTSPVRDVELILGKWLGSFLFMSVLILITLVYPITLNQLVDPGIDWGTVLTGYLGLLLMAAAFTALGTAISALFSNQIAAFVATLALFLVLWLIGFPAQSMNASPIWQYLDFSQHFYNTLAQGILDLRDIVYYLSITALGIFAGTMIVETRRWR
ncbi:MAG: ABC transporter permease subunit [Chloroflexi bacterium]|nr:ABC transporter permease subunit [Chloroflexota bacterium]